MTNFLPDHPGGERVLLSFAGKNATETFNSIHPPGVVEKYAPNAIIGMLEGAPPAAVGADNKAPLLDKDGQEEGQEPDSSFWALLPTRDYFVYFSFTVVIFTVLWCAVTQRFSLHLFPNSVAALVAFGPVVFALVLCQVFGESLDLRWPFQHETLFGKLGLHLVLGFLVGVLPVYHTLTTVMAEPVFCQLWDPTHQGFCAGVGAAPVTEFVLGL